MRPSTLAVALALAFVLALGAEADNGRLRLPAIPPARTVVVPILTYHRIDPPRPTLPEVTRKLTVDPGDFAGQMRWLKTHGFHTLTQRRLFMALMRGKRLPAKPVLLTFDDGYRDVFINAAPVLKRLRMHATAYVITGRIAGPDVSFLNWKQLRGLERAGIEIGSHTVSHTPLTKLSRAGALHELVRSRRALERALGHPVQWFSYPYGAFNQRIVGLVKRAGYVLAVTTQGGAIQSAAAPLELRRYSISDSTGVSGFAGLVSRASGL